mgnify:CR=1 FL=1
MDTEKITIGILNHDNAVYEKYVAESLKQLQGDFDLIIEKNKKPAQAYNDIIEKSKNRYIVFLHSDVTFSHEFIYNINKSIDRRPDFGAFCCVGVIKTMFGKVKIITSDIKKEKQVITSDSCCLVINKDHHLLFDATLFDEYHMYVEDYCTQVRLKRGLNIYTILNNWIWIQNEGAFFNNNPNPYNWFIHHSHTFMKRGAKWGKWQYYKDILDYKWKQKIITT